MCSEYVLNLIFLVKLCFGYMKDQIDKLSSALFFMLKKFVRSRANFHITYYSVVVRASQTFWATDFYFQIFFIMYPNLMSHQFLSNQRGN